MKKIILNPEQIQKIIDCYNLGDGERKIAEKIGVARGVIFRYLEELKLPTGVDRVFPKEKTQGIPINFTTEQLDHMKKLYESGDNIYIIAEKMNISPETVNRKLTKLNVKFRDKKIHFTDEQLNKMVEMYHKGDGLATIGESFGVVKTVINRVLREMNLPVGKDRIFPKDKFVPGVKIEISSDQMLEMKNLFDQGYTMSQIGRKLDIWRVIVRKCLHKLNISDQDIKQQTKRRNNIKRSLMTDRKCRRCNIILPLDKFSKRIKNGYIEHEYYCRECVNINNRGYEESVKEYRYKLKIKRESTPFFKLRHRVSCVIWQYLNKTGGSKYGHSCLQYIPYTIPQLKEHLESLFEPWMNWGNYGPYKKYLWDDNDPATWKWQIDHIIPHSTLPYNSMEDDNFKKCWSLDNLRPYSAKQNLLDGLSRVRHKDKISIT